MTKETDQATGSNWFLYLIEDAKGRFYAGITTDVERRFQEHCDAFAGVSGAKGAKFFRSSQPLRVVYREECRDRAEASRRERALKALPKSRKMALIAGVPVEDI